jgi:hypothetical protein
MGILDDLAMGFGFKEKDRDYYDRTAATISRDQGSDAGDRYRSSISERYAAAPNYGTAIGPSVSDFRQVANPGRDPYTSGGRLRSDFQPGSLAQTYRDANLPQPGTFMHKLTNMPTPMGVLARIISGYDAPPPQGELRSTYKPQRQQAPIIEPVAPITTAPARTEMSSFDFAPSLLEPDVQLEVFAPSDKAAADAGLEVGQPSDPRYMPGGEFDAFMEQVGSLPIFNKYRGDPARMRAIFEEYLKTQGGSN